MKNCFHLNIMKHIQKIDYGNTLILLVIFGLPFCTLIKKLIIEFGILSGHLESYNYLHHSELNISLFINPYFYLRVLLLIYVFCGFFFLKNKQISKIEIYLLIVFIIFFFNTLFNNTADLDGFFGDVTKNDGVSFLSSKKKDLLIFFFNIFILILLFCFKKINIDYIKLENQFKKFCYFFLIFFISIFFIILISYYSSDQYFKHYNIFLESNKKVSFFYFTLLYKFRETNQWLNSHFIAFIFTIHFLITLKNTFISNNKIKQNLFLLFFYSCIFIFCKIYIIFYLFFWLILINIFIHKFKLSSPCLNIIFLIISITPYSFILMNEFNLQSIDYRSSIYSFYISNLNEINFILGNSIYSKGIFTYPHNYILDIFFCSGLIGIILYLLVISDISKKILRNKFLLNILLINIIISSISSFFYFNIFFLTTLLISIQLDNKK